MRPNPSSTLAALALAALCPATACAQTASTVKIEKGVSYLGSSDNLRVSNGTAELVIPTDYGPRVMRYALVGSGDDGNVFATIPGPTVKSALGDWYIRGGHRLWHAPEGMPRSYEPDNDPVVVEIDGNTVKLIEPVEKTTQIQKEMWVTLDPTGTHVTVVHRLTNEGLFAVPMACWAMSAMNTGGTAILPEEPYQSHDDALLPVRPLVLWAYTNLTDSRFGFGKGFLTLHQDPAVKDPEKVGVLNRQGWAAYLHEGTLFLKRFAFDPSATYPDYDANNETFTNDVFLELETLGPLEEVAPGATITHTEDWWLFPKIDAGKSEADLATALAPALAASALSH